MQLCASPAWEPAPLSTGTCSPSLRRKNFPLRVWIPVRIIVDVDLQHGHVVGSGVDKDCVIGTEHLRPAFTPGPNMVSWEAGNECPAAQQGVGPGDREGVETPGPIVPGDAG